MRDEEEENDMRISDYLYTKVARLGSAALLTTAMAVGSSVAPAQAQTGHQHDNDRGTVYDRSQTGHDRDNNYDPRGIYGRSQTSTPTSESEIRRIGVSYGYSEGFDHGVADKQSGRSFDEKHGSDYRQALTGYNPRWNMQGTYQDAFRTGYYRGYRDAYQSTRANNTYYRSRNRNPYYGNTNPYYGNNNPYYGNNNPPYGNSDPYYGSNSGYGYGNYGTVDNRRGNKDPEEVAQIAARAGYYAGFERGQYDGTRDRRANPDPYHHGAYQFGLDGWNREWGSGQTYQQYYRGYFVQGYNDAYQRRRQTFTYRRF